MKKLSFACTFIKLVVTLLFCETRKIHKYVSVVLITNRAYMYISLIFYEIVVCFMNDDHKV